MAQENVDTIGRANVEALRPVRRAVGVGDAGLAMSTCSE
jgi:hypothetical protein